MSLRFRLVLLTLFLVAAVAVVLSALQVRSVIDSVSQDTLVRANLAGERVSAAVQDHINQHQPEYPVPLSNEETAALWYEIVSSDGDLSQLLLSTLSSYSEALLEINLISREGTILLSSSVGKTGQPVAPREPFELWSRLPWHQRVYDVLSRRPDWQVSPRPIGIAGFDDSVIEVQVVTSSFLLRLQLVELLQDLAVVSGGALLVALVLTLLATHSALRPLGRIERTIDRIMQGSFQAGEGRGAQAKEFQALESKLDTLGQKMASAKPVSGRLDVLMEQVASQLDVATRLSAISRLSSGVAHEIKNPLNAILLRLDLLKVRLGDADEEVAQELDILSKEVLRLNRVVTTFLDFSRPVEVHFADLDLAALVREVTELIRPQAEMARIAVELELPDGPAMMRGDADLLKQAVLNLATNAVEAMGAQGGRLEVRVTRSGANWALEVADTGPGIPRELRGQVFQLYFTTKSKGSGIGLAMTYRAAQLHNGTISFTSESGRGTTFRLEFPALVTHA